VSAKDYLRQARRLQERIDQLDEARSHVRPGSSAQISNQIDRELVKLEALRAEILEVVSQISNNTLATLLIAYYVNGKTWEETAEAMHYSREHVVRELHPKALAAAETILRRCHKIS